MSRERFPVRVDHVPTAGCNLKPPCPMCIEPAYPWEEMGTRQWKRIIDFFAVRGTGKQVFTGGEPLTREDIDELLRWAKSRGAEVTLSTNAVLLNDHIKEIKRSVDKVGVPIDGPTKEIHGLMRPGGALQFEAALAAIPMLREKAPNTRITVRTVASRLNFGSLSGLGELLMTLPRVDKWKIYMVMPARGIMIREVKPNWDDMKLRPGRFDEKIKKLQGKFPELNIVGGGLGDQLNGYVVVEPDGTIDYLYHREMGRFGVTPEKELEENLRGITNNF